MSYLSKLTVAGAIAGLTVLATPASAAVETFASYTQKTTGNTIQWSRGSKTLTKIGKSDVSFNFLLPGLDGFSPLSAAFTMSLTGTGNAERTSSNYLTQSNLAGSFSFIYTGAADIVVGSNTYHKGANLLSGTITNAVIGGQSGGSSAGVTSSTAAGATISYTSDFLTFTTNKFDFALSLTQVDPFLFANSGSSLNSFKAASTGSFSSDPRPIINGLPPVPEPATWAMMITGFALVGGSLRQRRLVRVAGAAAI